MLSEQASLHIARPRAEDGVALDRHRALGGSANWKDRVGVTEQEDAFAAPSTQSVFTRLSPNVGCN